MSLRQSNLESTTLTPCSKKGIGEPVRLALRDHDPDTALQTLREWAHMADVDGAYDDTESEAATAFRELDEWLTRQGALPRDWAAPNRG